MNAIIKRYFSKYFGEELGPRVKNAFINGGMASILGRGFPIVALMISAKILTAEQFGKFMLIYGAIISFSTLSEAGLGTTITKFTAQYKNSSIFRLSEILSTAQYISVLNILLVSFFIFIFQEQLVNYIFSDGSLRKYLILIIVTIFFIGLCNIQQAILYGLEDYKCVKRINFYTGLIVLLGLPLGASLYQIEGMIIAFALSRILNLIFLFGSTSSHFGKLGIRRLDKFHSADVKSILGFSLPTFLNSMLIGPVMLVAMSIVARHFDGNGHEQVGIYNAAYQWFSFILFISGVLSISALPILAEQISSGNKIDAYELVVRKIKLMMIIVAPVVLMVGLLAPYIMAIYGDDYAGYSSVLIILLLGAFVALPQRIIGVYIISNNAVWHWFAAGLCWAVVLLSVTLIFVNHGAIALAGGLLIAYIFKLVVAILSVKAVRS